MSEELKAVLGDRADAAVAHLVGLGQTEETAVGHLEMLIKGQGQFNAELDGNLAAAFPELLAKYLEAAAQSPVEGESTGEATSSEVSE